MPYLGNTPGVSSQRVVHEFSATEGQTLFTPSGGYMLGYVDVLLNGVELAATDFTAADGINVFLTTGASAGDEVKIKVWLPRGLSDGYLKSEADALLNAKVNKAGDTMTGPLVLPGNPTTNLQAAPKQYVDSAVAGVDLSTRVAKSGDTMTGFLTLNANPTNNLHAATKQYVDTADANNVTLTGSQTISGTKTFSSTTNTQTIVNNQGYYTTFNTGVGMYEMHLPGIQARAWYLDSSGITRLGVTNGSGTVSTVLMSCDGSGNLGFNSGYGSVATAYGCRAWVKFNGTSGSINGSGNVSSVSRYAVGRYQVNLTTAMPDTNGSVACSAVDGLSFDAGVANWNQEMNGTFNTTSQVYCGIIDMGNNFQDNNFCHVTIFR